MAKKASIEVSALRRQLFTTLEHIGQGGIEITRHGQVIAVLGPPPRAKIVGKPQINSRRLARVCRRHHIQRLALFGSITRDDFSPDSDVDVLIDPEPGHLRTIGEYTAAHQDLVKLFGRPVDLLKRANVERSDNEIRRQEILDTAKVIYVA